jgi:hypothetical protein
VGHRDALKFKQIDLQQPFLISDKLNFLDGTDRTIGGNPEIPGRLRRPRVGVVTKPGKESSNSISTTEALDILPA